MSNEAFQAIWDHESGLVAIFLTTPNRPRHAVRRFHLFLEPQSSSGSGAGHRRFLGIFDTRILAPDDWESLPPWIVVRVDKHERFRIRLEPQIAKGAAPSWELKFDASIRYDFKKRSLDENRFYAAYADSSADTGDDSQAPVQHLEFRNDGVEQGHRSRDDLIRFWVEQWKRRSCAVRFILAYAVRAHHFGPAVRIYEHRSWIRELAVEGTFEDYEIKPRDTGQTATCVQRHYFGLRSLNMPKLIVWLGSDRDDARQRQGFVIFLHIRLNAIRAAMDMKTLATPQGARMRRIFDRYLERERLRTGQSELVSFSATSAASLKLQEDRQGCFIEHAFEEVALGDIVGLFVKSKVNVRYETDGEIANAPEDGQQVASTLYLRFLSDRLVPIELQKVENAVLGKVLDEVNKRLGGSPDDRSHSSAGNDPVIPTIDASAGSELFNLLYKAFEASLTKVEPQPSPTRKFAASSQQAQPQRPHRRGRTRKPVTLEVFRRVPVIAHTMCGLPQFAEAVRKGGQGIPADGSNLVEAAVTMASDKKQTRAWAARLTHAAQQMLAWEMLSLNVDFLDRAARHNVAIEEDDSRRDADLGEIYEMMRRPRRREGGLIVLTAFEETEAARVLADMDGRLRTDSHGRPLPFADLDRADRELELAQRLLQADLDRVDRIVQVARLAWEGSEDFDRIEMETIGKQHPDEADELRAGARKGIQEKIEERSARAEARKLLDGVRLVETLRVVARLFDEAGHGDAIWHIVLSAADDITDWANGYADRAFKGEKHERGRRFDREAWDALGPVLRGENLVAGAVKIESLMRKTAVDGGLPWADRLAPAALGLLKLVQDARSKAENLLDQSHVVHHQNFRAHLDQLRAYADVAFSTCVAGKLLQLADAVRRELAPPLFNGAGHVEKWNAHVPEIRSSWNRLGRALAPECGLRLLPEALDQARILVHHAQQLTGREMPGPAIEPPPGY